MENFNENLFRSHLKKNLNSNRFFSFFALKFFLFFCSREREKFPALSERKWENFPLSHAFAASCFFCCCWFSSSSLNFLFFIFRWKFCQLNKKKKKRQFLCMRKIQQGVENFENFFSGNFWKSFFLQLSLVENFFLWENGKFL